MTVPNPLPPASPFDRLQLRWLLIWVFAWLLVTALAASSISAWLGLAENDPLTSYIAAIGLYVIIGSWTLIALPRQDIRWTRLIGDAPSPHTMRLSVGIAITALLLSIAVLSLIYARFTGSTPLTDSRPEPAVGEAAYPNVVNALSIVVFVILGPVVEEVLFRGILLHRWAARWNPRAAMLYTSLLYAILHVEIIGQFVFALLLAKLYIKSRSLHAPIFCHMVTNGFAVVSGLGVVSPTTENAMTLIEILRDKTWIGLSCLALAFPLILYYMHELETDPGDPLPYDAKRPLDPTD